MCRVLTIVAATFAAAVIAHGQRGDPVAAPELVGPGVISTGDHETHPQFSPDGGTLYFLKNTPNFSFWTIVVSRRRGNTWSEPEVAPFSGQHSDADPFITADGSRFYFISDRPVDGRPKQDMDIWFMDRTSSGWGAPQHPGGPINSEASEWFPTVAASGTLYFGSGRDGGQGRTDLYRARFAGGRFGDPENLGNAVNSPADEFEPLISPDERVLIFMAAGRREGLGAGDLYVSYRQNNAPDGEWSAAKNLGTPINSPAQEIGPMWSPDGAYFYFSSARTNPIPRDRRRTYAELLKTLRGPGNGLGDIYRLPRAAVLNAR